MRRGFHIKAASAAGGHPRITGEAYMGGKISQFWWDHPLVIDLAGMKLAKQVPLLSAHRNAPEHRLGLLKPFKVDGVLQIEGAITSSTDEAKNIVDQGDAGDDWQLSVGAAIKLEELVDVGVTRKVNGQEHGGPFYHIRKSVLQEVSVVPLGADSDTRGKIHAMALTGGSAMNFKAWLEARGIDIAALGEDEIKMYRVEFDTEIKAAQSALTTGESERSRTVIPATADPGVIAAAAVRVQRGRGAGIRTACGGEFREIEAEAIASEATVDQVRAKVLTAIRSARPTGINNAIRPSAVTGDVLEAAIALSARIASPDKHFAAPVLEAAAKRFRGGIGLQEMLIEAARANGYQGSGMRDHRAVLEHAFSRQVQAAFSTLDVGGMLSNTSNTSLVNCIM